MRADELLRKSLENHIALAAEEVGRSLGVTEPQYDYQDDYDYDDILDNLVSLLEDSLLGAKAV